MLALMSLGLLTGAQDSFGQAPALGKSADFSIFTAVGDVNNFGATAVSGGHIGTNLGVISGFPPGTHTGGIKYRENTFSAEVAKDVDAAYASLDAITTGTAHGATLGNETLMPGTYVLSTAATLAGTLTLDAGGIASAVFILKIAAGLTTATSSAVVLTGSASWTNVYWQIDGPTELGSNSAFAGTIVGNNTISLLNSAALQGRALTRTGVITLNANTVNGPTLANPLPVQLTAFTADEWLGSTLLRWATASENNNAYFAMQSSSDGRQYRTIGRVNGQATTSQPYTYSWTDSQLDRYRTRLVYYRLKQVDTDSSVHYSPVRTVAVTAPATADLQLQVYPSPSRLPCSLHVSATHEGPATLRLTDALGHVVTQRQVLLLAGSTLLPLDEAKSVPAGLYLVQLAQGTEHQTIRLVRE